MKKILGVGVIGTGQIAQIAHLPFLTEMYDRYEVRAICDLSEKILKIIGNRYGIARRYTDYRELLNQPDIDVVLVSTVDHADIAIAALNAGKHVFCEKPMAFNLEQCDAMIEVANRNKVKLNIGYMKRHDPGFEFAMPLFNGIKGLQYIHVHDLAGSYKINKEIYDLVAPDDVPQATKDKAIQVQKDAMVKEIGKKRADLVETYSILLSLCSHDSIVLHEAFGSPTKIQHVDVFGNNCTVAILEYGPDVRCVWETGWLITRPNWDEYIQAYGENRMVQVEFPFPYIKNAITYVHVNEMENGVDVQKKFEVSFDEAFKREWRHFHECLTEDKQPITDGTKGRRDVAFLSDLIKKARE